MRALFGRRPSPGGRRTLLEASAVVIVALVLAIVATWPVAARTGTVITSGQYGGDPLGYLWDTWEHARFGFSVFGTGVQSFVGAPFGRPVSLSANATILVSTLPTWLLAKLTTPIVAYNVMQITALTLSGGSMYLLVRWLGLGVVAAAWAGVSYELLPYELLRISAHPPLAHIWCFPLLMIAGLRFVGRRSWRRAFWLALAFALCWATNPYYGAMATLVVTVVLVIAAIAQWRVAGPLRAAAALGRGVVPVALLVVLPLAILAKAASAADAAITRNRVELALYGAHLRDYLLPAAGNAIVHAFVGTDASLPPGGERTVFPGFLTLPLAIVGLVVAVRSWPTLSGRVKAAVACGVPIAVLAFWVSLASPYDIFGQSVDMPSSYIFDLVPYLRAYARFGTLVAVVLIVLGAIGLRWLTAGRHRATAASVASVALLVPFLVLPLGGPLAAGVPGEVNGVAPSRVPTWQWLHGREPGQILLETPAAPDELMDRVFMFGQTVHGHRIANGSLGEPNLAGDFLTSVDLPTTPGVAGRLATAGIRLVAIEPWAWAARGLAAPTAPTSGYRLLVRFRDGSELWSVDAKPLPAIAIFRTRTWWAPQDVGGTTWRYMRDRAVVTVLARRTGRYTIRFEVQGRPGRANRLLVTLPDGTRRNLPVTSGVTEVTLGTRLRSGTSNVVLERVGAPATQISATDLRVVSVRVSGWRVVPAGAAVTAAARNP